MVAPWVWGLTVVFIAALLAYDYFFHVRVPHAPTLKEAAVWSGIFVGIALLFGGAVWVFGGPAMGLEYFAGYITEKALSVDNLFVFLLIMTGFRVPAADQQKVLLFGIVFSLFARTAFIFVGAAMLEQWAWMFYIFGGLLIFVAGKQLAPEDDDEGVDKNIMVRIARRFLRTTDYYDSDKLFTMVNGRRAMTPMLLVMVAIGGTDLLFALDSIPAIFGLTQNVYIVFTATVFSLLGLRQLYFLLDGLLDRLIYLKYGLAAILGFIGTKLILHALHENNVPFINGGEPVPVLEIETGFSLLVISGVLIVTIIASLVSGKGRALTTIRNARRHAAQYLDASFQDDPALREATYLQLLAEEKALLGIHPNHRELIRDEQELLDLLDEAHRVHNGYVSDNPGRYPDGDPHAGQPTLPTQDYRPAPTSPDEPSGE